MEITDDIYVWLVFVAPDHHIGKDDLRGVFTTQAAATKFALENLIGQFVWTSKVPLGQPLLEGRFVTPG